MDDEFDLRSTLAMLLELHGFQTLNASNGEQALQVLQKQTPDLIISDCMMPVMDGIALSRAVRANPATATLPIILMSAAPQQHNFSAAPHDAFLKKPFQLNELLTAIDRVMPPAA